MRGSILAALLAAAALAVPMAGHADGWGRGGPHRGHGSHYGGHGYHGYRGHHGGYHGHHGYWGGYWGPRVVVGFGAPYGYWWGAPGLGWYWPSPMVVAERTIVSEPPVYVERGPAQEPGAYWYYCDSAGAYYPDVPSCPEPWILVPPRPE